MYNSIDQYNIQEFSSWSPSFDKKLIIAGPCSAESEKQVLNTAEAIVNDINIFRVGIWKARTQPKTFTGIGKSGLKWLKKVEELFNIPTMIEVLSPEHVKYALDHNIKYVWLGARTTVNPYLTEEIALALAGSDMRVFIKNPMVPDISLWMGAIERINNAGINKIAAIHRGFQSMYSAPYRNEPIWEIPIKLKCMFPSLPILCDPSHIAGKTEYIEEIVNKALSLDMSGLMIETHISPKDALSDRAQQLSPGELHELLKSIDSSQNNIINSGIGQIDESVRQIETLRKLIDSLDESMLKTISQRLKAVEEIGKLKKDINIPALQVSRWKEIIENRINIGNNLNLPEKFVEKLMEIIHYEALKRQ
ncbi:MAG: bifunctional 3-deoxy-7-phosphoheptulonate synthase/chorismate mutase type II [Bacteroidales bacterium]|jgi:chorismate mutase|nr:bifunctional 3-deoxy-7-phosphoheptulonate synthase/chorismate mutase type II [Bacteroidales bacterium]